MQFSASPIRGLTQGTASKSSKIQKVEHHRVSSTINPRENEFQSYLNGHPYANWNSNSSVTKKSTIQNGSKRTLVPYEGQVSSFQSSREKPLNETCKENVPSVEQLLKKIRVLKNEHEVEKIKYHEEIKSKTHKILQLQTSLDQSERKNRLLQKNNEHHPIELHNAKRQVQDYKASLQELETQNHNLKKKLNVLENKNFELQTGSLKIEPQVSPKRTDQVPEKVSKKRIHQSQESLLEEIKEIQNELQFKNQEILGLTNEVHEGKKGIKEIIRKAELNETSLIKEIRSLREKSKSLEADLKEKKQEMSGMLTKLKPLLEDRHEGTARSESKASLSLLQIYLQKYKIQAF